MQSRAEILATGKVGGLVLKFSIPSVVGMLVSGLYNVMDRVFVGRGVGADALAGVAIVFPLMLLVMASGMFVGLGASSLIALRLGEGRRKDAEAAVGNAMALALIVATGMTLVIALFTRPILVFLGGSGPVLDYALAFTRTFLPGAFLQVLAFSLNNMIRGQGDPMTALLTMVISAGVNCLLNPLFIFVFKMGIAGSALATDIAQLVSVAWLLVVYRRTTTGIRLRLRDIRLNAALTRDILGIGMVPAFVQVATVAGLVFANHLVTRYGGATGLAALGIVNSLINLMLMPIIGINQGIQPIIGFNYGAGLYGRARKAFLGSVLACVGICSLAYAFFWAFSSQVLGLFLRDSPEVVALGVQGLRIFFASLPVLPVVILGSGYFQAIKRGPIALIPNLLRQLGLLFPLYLVLPRFMGLKGIWLANPISDLAAVAMILSFLLPEMRRLSGLSGGPDSGSTVQARSV